jgi:hypothetical protein
LLTFFNFLITHFFSLLLKLSIFNCFIINQEINLIIYFSFSFLFILYLILLIIAFQYLIAFQSLLFIQFFIFIIIIINCLFDYFINQLFVNLFHFERYLNFKEIFYFMLYIIASSFTFNLFFILSLNFPFQNDCFIVIDLIYQIQNCG